MITHIESDEPQFRSSRAEADITQNQLAFILEANSHEEPRTARDRGIELSADPDEAANPDRGQWAVQQLIAKGVPFFARELIWFLGKPKYPRAFAHVVGRARKEGTIRIVAWGRPANTDGALAALWLAKEQKPVTPAMFNRPEIRSFFMIPESVGLSSADIQQEFTAADCADLAEMPTHKAAKQAIDRLIENRAYFSAETIAAMLAQARQPALESRRAICGVIQSAYKARRVEIHDILPSANATRNKGKVIVYRGTAQ